MAAPSIISGYNTKLSFVGSGIIPTATTIKTTTIPAFNRIRFNGFQVSRFSTAPTVGQKLGGRVSFPSINLSTDDYVAWQHNNEYSNAYSFRTPECYILFEDSSGNWSEFLIYSSDNHIYNTRSQAGNFYNRENLAAGRNFLRILDRSEPTTDSSGTLNWADIVAIEIHGVTNFSITDSAACGYVGEFATLKNNVILNGDSSSPITLERIEVLISSTTSDPYDYFQGTMDFDGQNGETRVAVNGIDIGDYSTPTRFQQRNFSLYVFQKHDAVNYRNFHTLSDITKNLIHVKQSADCYYLLENGVISSRSTGEYSLFFEGNSLTASRLVKNVTIWRPVLVAAKTFDFDGVIIDGFTDGLAIDDHTNLINTTIRNGASGSRGLIIDSAAGDYSGIDILLENNSGSDLTLGSGGAGIYDLTGIRVNSGYTLKIRNNSVTNAVTVIIKPDTAFSTSTAGGAITVNSPATTYTLQLPNIINGSRFQIYNVSTATELTNAIVSGGLGVNAQYTKGIDYSSGDTGRYRITYQSGANAMNSIEGAFTFSNDTTINAIPVIQEAQSIYETYGVDGSTISEFIWDSGNIQVDINDSDNRTNIQRLGAWYYYFIATEMGINEAFDAILWESLNSIRINTSSVDMTFDNVKSTPLFLTGGRIYRDDGATIIASSSSSLQVDYDPVYTIQTGISGLTEQESAQLSAINGYADEIHKIHGLDASSPLTVTPTGRIAGDISQIISGDGQTSSTVTRT